MNMLYYGYFRNTSLVEKNISNPYDLRAFLEDLENDMFG